MIMTLCLLQVPTTPTLGRLLLTALVLLVYSHHPFRVAMVSSSSRSSRSYQPVHVYSYTVDVSTLQGDYATWKRIHIVRHAEGTHNVDQDYKDMAKQLDALQLQAASHLSQVLDRTELVVTSPLTRCLQTAMLSFPTLTDNPKIPFVALEAIRETVNYACDRRRPISELEPHFQDRVNFDEILHDHDELWEQYERRLGSNYIQQRESGELHRVADRAREFFTWVRARPEQELIVCTHSAFLRALVSWGQPGGVLWIMPQVHDSRHPKPEQEIPILQYRGDDEDFEAYMRRDYDNCELRSFMVAFPN
jgi:broad specificity phosphatase PhoE